MTIRHYSPLFALFAIRHYSLFAIHDYSLFAIRDYSLFAIRYSGFPDTRLFWISQKPNLIIVLLYIKQNKKKTSLWFFTDGKKNKASELDMITLRNHAPRSYTTWLPVTLTWLPVTLTWLLNNLQLWCHRHRFRKLTVRFRPIRKEIVSSMYNNLDNWTKRHKIIRL